MEETMGDNWQTIGQAANQVIDHLKEKMAEKRKKSPIWRTPGWDDETGTQMTETDQS
jgi:hypothetical protein